MTEPTPDPAALLGAAADRLRQPIGPEHPAIVAPALVEPLAAWLVDARHRQLANEIAAEAVFATDTTAATRWLHEMTSPGATATARAILALAARHDAPTGAPHGPQDAAAAVGAGTETPGGRNGPQTAAQPFGLRDRIAAALEAANYREGMRRGDLADAVMPVVQRYAEQLAAGRETWRRRAEEIEQDRDRHATEVARLTGLLAEYADRGIANGQRADQAEATVRRVRQMAHAWRDQLPDAISRDTASQALLDATEQYAHLDQQ